MSRESCKLRNNEFNMFKRNVILSRQNEFVILFEAKFISAECCSLFSSLIAGKTNICVLANEIGFRAKVSLLLNFNWGMRKVALVYIPFLNA